MWLCYVYHCWYGRREGNHCIIFVIVLYNLWSWLSAYLLSWWLLGQGCHWAYCWRDQVTIVTGAQGCHMPPDTVSVVANSWYKVSDDLCQPAVVQWIAVTTAPSCRSHNSSKAAAVCITCLRSTSHAPVCTTLDSDPQLSVRSMKAFSLKYKATKCTSFQVVGQVSLAGPHYARHVKQTKTLITESYSIKGQFFTGDCSLL